MRMMMMQLSLFPLLVFFAVSTSDIFVVRFCSADPCAFPVFEPMPSHLQRHEQLCCLYGPCNTPGEDNW